tara:strand:+ start:2218 stop:3378 length:1161 start_codon:yes stop_codon:yes gene_type:complete
MTSTIYSVALQMIISATNLILYFMLASKLNQSDFIIFSSAVSISIMAYAIAESGISYVAPLILSKSHVTRKVLNTSFIIISLTVYILNFCVLYVLWNLFADTHVEFTWAFAYGLYFLPVMFIPAWSTCWYVNLTDVFLVTFGRVWLLAVVFINPTAETLNIGSALYVIFMIIFLRRTNNRADIFKIPRLKHFKFVLAKLRVVFFAKTTTYFIYSSIPLFVSANYGAAAAAMYLLGERLKSTYATLFQPIIQTLYLRQFQSTVLANQKNKVMPSMVLLNLGVTAIVILLLSNENSLISGLGFDRLMELEFFNVYILAACISVLSSCFLFFRVLPNARYDIFQVGVYFQSGIFFILFFVTSFFINMDPAYILLMGELSLLLFLFFRRV